MDRLTLPKRPAVTDEELEEVRQKFGIPAVPEPIPNWLVQAPSGPQDKLPMLPGPKLQLYTTKICEKVSLMLAPFQT